MSRTIELTTTITLTVKDDQTFDVLRRDVDRRMRAAFGPDLTDAADAVRIVALHDPAGTLTRPPSIHPLLSRFGAIAKVWSVGDVLDVRPDYTPQQAAVVLQHALHRHEARHGLDWDDLEVAADELFGVTQVAGDTSGAHP